MVTVLPSSPNWIDWPVSPSSTDGGTHVVAESGVSQTVVVGLEGLGLRLGVLRQQVEAGVLGGDPLGFEGFPLVVGEFGFVLDGLLAQLGIDAIVEGLEGSNLSLDVVGEEFLTCRLGRLELGFEGFPLVVGGSVSSKPSSSMGPSASLRH